MGAMPGTGADGAAAGTCAYAFEVEKKTALAAKCSQYMIKSIYRDRLKKETYSHGREVRWREVAGLEKMKEHDAYLSGPVQGMMRGPA